MKKVRDLSSMVETARVVNKMPEEERRQLVLRYYKDADAKSVASLDSGTLLTMALIAYEISKIAKEMTDRE